jgi:branched-chain amino acid transport system substrate-binding protein
MGNPMPVTALLAPLRTTACDLPLRLFWILAVVFILFRPALADTEENSKGVVLGAVYNMSGSQAELDVPSSRGAQLAVEQINRDGGLLGHDVELILAEGDSTLREIATKTQELLSQRAASVSALIGLSDTDMVLAAAPLAAGAQRVFLTSGATSPLLPAEVPDYLFLACFGDNVQAAAGAEWAYEELSARTAAVLFDETNSYTRLLQGYFQKRFRALGGQIISVGSYTPGAVDEAIGRLGKTDLIFLSAQVAQDAAAAVKALRAADFAVPILGGDGYDAPSIWAANPDLGDVFFTTHAYLGADNPDPNVALFVDAYEAAYPGDTPNAFAALGYDAANLIMQAIEHAGSGQPQQVRTALEGVRRFEGVTGTLSYPEGSRIPVKSVTIIEIAQGSFKLVQEVTPSEVPTP